MQVTCGSCNKSLNIPDEKIPKGQPFSFACPACKNKITVNPDAASETNPVTVTDETGGIPADTFSGSDAPGAMVCHTSPEPFKPMLEKLGYQVHAPQHHIEAVNNLRFNDYKVVLITDDFINKPAEQANIFEHLQNMLMGQRRRIFVVYVANKARSYDVMEAFAKSVDLIVSKDDAGKETLADAVARGVREHDRAYKVYFDIMGALGKV